MLVSIVSAAVAIVSAIIEAVIDVFSGVADLITGVVFIIGGIVNGSWADIWLGMKLVVFGVVDAIIGVILELAGAIAGVIDAVTGFFGEGTRWQAGIRGLRDSIRSSMAEGMGVQGVNFTAGDLRSSSWTSADSVQHAGLRPLRFMHDRAGPVAAPATAPAAPLSAPMPAVASMSPMTPASPLMSPVTPPPASPVVVNIQVDGSTLATAVHRADRNAANRSFSPVPVY